MEEEGFAVYDDDRIIVGEIKGRSTKKKLTSFVVPDSVEEISDDCFGFYTKLTSIKLPKKLKKIVNWKNHIMLFSNFLTILSATSINADTTTISIHEVNGIDVVWTILCNNGR